MFALLSLCRADKGTVLLGSRSLVSVDQTGTVATGVAPPWNACQLGQLRPQLADPRLRDPDEAGHDDPLVPLGQQLRDPALLLGQAPEPRREVEPEAGLVGRADPVVRDQPLLPRPDQPNRRERSSESRRRPEAAGLLGLAEQTSMAPAAAGRVADAAGRCGRTGSRCWRSR